MISCRASKRVSAATRIQTRYRVVLDRRLLSEVRSLTAQAQGLLDRDQCEIESTAAVMIQAAYRSYSLNLEIKGLRRYVQDWNRMRSSPTVFDPGGSTEGQKASL